MRVLWSFAELEESYVLPGFGFLGHPVAAGTNRSVLYGIAAITVFAFVAFRRAITPYLAMVRRPRDDESVSYPLKSAYGPPGETMQ